MKKLFIVLVITPVVIAVLGIVAMLALINWPTLLVNETTLGMAARHLATFGVQMQWTEVSTESQSHGFMDETLGISFEDVCVTVKPALEKGCFTKVDLHARYIFEGLLPRLVGIGPVTIEGGDIVLRFEEQEDDGKKLEGRIPLPRIALPSWLHHVVMHPISIGVDKLVIHRGDVQYDVVAAIRADATNDHRLSEVEIRGMASESPAGRSIKIDAVVQSPSGFIDDDWQAKAQATASLGGKGTAALDANFTRGAGRVLDHTVDITYADEGLNVQASLVGKLDEDSLDTMLKAKVDGISEVVPSIGLPQCAVKLIATDLRQNKGELTLSCPIDIDLKKFVLPAEMKKVYKPPERLRVNVAAKANTFFIPDLDKKTDGTIDVRIEPTTGRLVTTEGGLKITFSGIPAMDPTTWTVESDVDIDFVIDQFSRLIAVMDTTPWPVPAPFNVLEGLIDFSLNGHLSTVTELAHFPAKLTTRLSSEKQRIDIDSEGEVTLGFGRREGTDLKLEVTLTDVQLQLPAIAVAGIPRFTPDGRIILSREEVREREKPPVPFGYDIHVTTPQDTPARILSNLTSKHIPLYVDATISNEDMSGSIRIGEFPVELFSRKATLEKFNVELTQPAEMSVVDGSMSIPFPELDVIIAMKGPIAEPAIIFSSNPPLPESDILATLLYGETMGNIDSDQADSVSSMSAAVTNRAMALTSFFLLGSTPIQSVAYNPQTGMFTARIKLAKTTSLVVGGGGGEQQAMIRQRLGKGFSISAGADKSSDEEQVGGSAYIEWSKRF